MPGGKILRTVGRHLGTRLLAGFLVIIPLGFTYFVLKFIFDLLDPLPQDMFLRIFGREFRGAGLAVLVIIIYLVGLLATTVLGRRIIALGHRLVEMIPVVRPIYRAARETIDTLSKMQREYKDSRVVLLEFPSKGLRSVGLVTATLKDDKGTPIVAVYIPTSPTPNSGYLVMVPETAVTPIPMSFEEAMKLVISAGVLSPSEIPSDAKATPQPANEEASKRASNQ